MTATHSSGASVQAVGIHRSSRAREQAAFLAVVIGVHALTSSGISDDPCRTGLLPQLVQLAQLGYMHAGVQLNSPSQAQSGQVSPADPGRTLPAHSRNTAAPTTEFKKGQLCIAVRGDSLLATRSDTAKKKSYKTFKAEFEEQFWNTFGRVHVDYALHNGELVQKITKGIEMGPFFDVMFVGIGMNDLMELGDNNIVKTSYPQSLDMHLFELGKAIQEKCKVSLVIVGGPACVWKYPSRWDLFVERAHCTLADAGVNVVPLREVADVMKQMKLSFDEMHFAHDDDNKTFFAKALASWLQVYAGVKKVEQSSGWQNSGWCDSGQKRWRNDDDAHGGQGSRRRV